MGIQNKKFEYLKKLKMKVSTFLLATIVCGTASIRIPGSRTMRPRMPTSNSLRLPKISSTSNSFRLPKISSTSNSFRLPKISSTSNSFRLPKISSILSRPSFTSPGRTSGLSLPKPPTFTSRLSSSTGLLNRSKSLLGLGGTSRGLLGRSQTGVGGLSSTGTSTGRSQSVRKTILPKRPPVGTQLQTGTGASDTGNFNLLNRPPVGISARGRIFK